MFYKKITSWICLIFICLPFVKAQLPKGVSLESSVYFGKVLKHTPKLRFESPPLSIGLDFHVTKQLYGQKAWHEWMNYPSVGLSLVYYDIGSESLGKALGLFPTIDLRFRTRPKFQSKMQIGLGLAYLTRYYDALTNPDNNAVGSNVNGTAQIKWQNQYSVSNNWQILFGLSVTHYSNGSSQQPNFGINIGAAQFGVKWQPNKVNTVDAGNPDAFGKGYIHRDTSSKPTRRFGVSMHAGMTYVEPGVLRGPRYPFYFMSIGGLYRTSKVNQVLLGFDYEYDKSTYYWSLHSATVFTEEDANKAASRWSVFVADEIFFGNFSFWAQTGYYLNHKTAISLTAIWYNKIGLRYHFPPIGRPKTRFFVGSYLKTHRVAAEYMGLGFGASF
jgi:Lipid A 3-O-deacylase (PagL)